MGFFSWMTKDTNDSIANRYSGHPTFPVFMVLPDGTTYQEDNYEGYGVFGGKDYYEALAEINGLSSSRYVGIDLAYKGEPIIWPQLVTDPEEATDFSTPNVSCPHQGFFYPGSGDDDEEYE